MDVKDKEKAIAKALRADLNRHEFESSMGIEGVKTSLLISIMVLELDGPNACFITTFGDIHLAAKRIVFSEYLNAGQICLSGNHVFIDPSVHDEFVEKIIYWIGQFVKDEGKDHAVRIVNERNYDRLVGLLDQTEGKIVCRGMNEREDKHIAPTVDITIQGNLRALTL